MPTHAQLLVEDAQQPKYPVHAHPDKLRGLQRGTHPLGKHPAMAGKASTDTFHAAYQHLIGKLARYTGMSMQENGHYQTLPALMFELLERVTNIEAANRPRVEALALEAALKLPQFTGLDEAIKAGHLKVDAKLEDEVDLDGVQLQQDQPEEEPEAAEVAKEIEELVLRRKFTNHLIQGGATNSAYAFHLVDDELRELDPKLPEAYGILMACAELGHWVTGNEAVAAALEQDMAKGGKSELKVEGDKVVVKARAKTLPMLVHEVVKGLLEYLSYSDEEDPETMKRVNSLADVIDDEPWQLILGPELWRRLLGALEDQKKFPKVYDKLMRMPTGEFNQLMTLVVNKDPKAKGMLAKLAA